MLSLKACDIMSCDLLYANEGWSIHRLAEFLLQNKITGAPVISTDGTLTGVVSTTDIFQFENMGDNEKVDALRHYYQRCSPDSFTDKINLADLQNWSHRAEHACTVEQIMHKGVISVDESCAIKELSQLMLDENIHRVFVKRDDHVCGLVTTSNVLKLVADQ